MPGLTLGGGHISQSEEKNTKSFCSKNLKSSTRMAVWLRSFMPFLLCASPNCWFQVRRVVGAEWVHTLCLVVFFFFFLLFFQVAEANTVCEWGVKQCPSSYGCAQVLWATTALQRPQTSGGSDIPLASVSPYKLLGANPERKSALSLSVQLYALSRRELKSFVYHSNSKIRLVSVIKGG